MAEGPPLSPERLRVARQCPNRTRAPEAGWQMQWVELRVGRLERSVMDRGYLVWATPEVRSVEPPR
jgi:hypothetical protein